MRYFNKNGVLIAVPNAETNIFAVLHCPLYHDNNKSKLVIWEDTTKKEIKVIGDSNEVLNCFFAKEWFLVAERQRIVVYDQQKDFQKLLIFDNMNYTYATMKYYDDHFFFAFADVVHGELNGLLLFDSNNYSSITSSIKEKRELIAFSNDLKYMAYTTIDTKMLRILNVSNLKKVFRETKLGSRNPISIHLITENIILLYYNNNSFELIDLSKSVKSYLIFSSPLVLKFVLTDSLCLYEYNKHTKPIVLHEIDYYDRHSIRSVGIVIL